MTLRKLEAVTYQVPLKPVANAGQRGEFKWLRPDQLVIDSRYQRDVGSVGKKNIKQIVENFDWAMFSPLIVAPRLDRLFAVIDGQHRAIAALTHGGVGELPCYVISADAKKQAKAFAVINGQVTAVQTLALFKARLEAGEPRAVAISEVTTAAGMTIIQKQGSGQFLKHGQTQSPNSIGFALERYGRDVTLAALNCITKSGVNPGMGNESMIAALAEVMWCSPHWRAHPKLYGALANERLENLYRRARQKHAELGGTNFRSHLVDVLKLVLTCALGTCEFRPLPQTPLQMAKAKELKERGLSERVKKAAAKGRANQVRRPDGKIAAKTPPVQNRPPPPTRKPEVIAAERPTKSLPGGDYRPNIAPAAKVSADTRELIDEHLRTKGARRFETGATGNVSILVEWLNRVAKVPAQVISTMKDGGRGIYMVRGKRRNLDGLIAVVNEERAKLKLPPLTKEKAA